MPPPRFRASREYPDIAFVRAAFFQRPGSHFPLLSEIRLVNLFTFPIPLFRYSFNLMQQGKRKSKWGRTRQSPLDGMRTIPSAERLQFESKSIFIFGVFGDVFPLLGLRSAIRVSGRIPE
jgi:hypothetical protein